MSSDKILTNEIRHTQSRTVAGERMALEAIEQVKLLQILRDLNLSETHIKLVCVLIVARQHFRQKYIFCFTGIRPDLPHNCHCS